MFRRRALRLSLLFILACAFSGWLVSSAWAAVTLTFFGLEVSATQVDVLWITASELDTVGFYINRGASQFGAYQRISDLIEAGGDAYTGQSYRFEDPNVITGATYYYKLEVLSTSNESRFYGPLIAIPGQPTVTPTLTATRTPTQTSTNPPVSSATRTPTNTPSPTARGATNTPIPQVLPTFTPRPSPTTAPGASGPFTPTINPYPAPGATQFPAATQSSEFGTTPFASPGPQTGVGGTPTLIPLPTFVVQFVTPSMTPRSVALLPTGSVSATAINSPAPAPRLPVFWLAGGLLVIWLGLGAWLFYTLRRLT